MVRGEQRVERCEIDDRKQRIIKEGKKLTETLKNRRWKRKYRRKK